MLGGISSSNLPLASPPIVQVDCNDNDEYLQTAILDKARQKSPLITQKMTADHKQPKNFGTSSRIFTS
jgi:hypothetical protein